LSALVTRDSGSVLVNFVRSLEAQTPPIVLPLGS